jgi:hypothetical protein
MGWRNSRPTDMPYLLKKAQGRGAISPIIAWVDQNPAAKQLLRFVETVLKNRSVFKGGLFENVEEAKKWLLKKD